MGQRKKRRPSHTSQTNQTTNETNTKANKADNAKHEQQGLRRNDADKGIDPGNRSRNKQRDRIKKILHSYSRMSRRIRPTPRPTKATITKSRIKGLLVIAPTKDVIQPTADVTKEVTSPRMEETVTAVVKHSPFLTNMNDISNQRNNHKGHGEADKITNRLREQESRQLRKEPHTKIHHRLQKRAPPSRKIQ